MENDHLPFRIADKQKLFQPTMNSKYKAINLKIVVLVEVTGLSSCNIHLVVSLIKKPFYPLLSELLCISLNITLTNAQCLTYL